MEFRVSIGNEKAQKGTFGFIIVPSFGRRKGVIATHNQAQAGWHPLSFTLRPHADNITSHSNFGFAHQTCGNSALVNMILATVSSADFGECIERFPSS
jgi:hypothetical protein